MNTFFEIGMLLCFGAAWPFSVYKSWKSNSNDGKSIAFLLVILAGYINAILFKITGNMNYVFGLYLFNTVMVSLDILLYIRNAASGELTAERRRAGDSSELNM